MPRRSRLAIGPKWSADILANHWDRRRNCQAVLGSVDRARAPLLACLRSWKALRGWEADLARATLVGNGSILASGDAFGVLHELYAPSLAAEAQLLRRPARIGMWTDSRLHWIPEGFEARPADCGSAPLVARSLVSEGLGIEVWIETFVDALLGALVRRVQVTNGSDRHRDLRLVLHHDFALLPGEPRETACLEPTTGGLLHRAGRRFVLVNMETRDGQGVPLWRVASRLSPDAPGADALPPDGRIESPLRANGRVDSIAGAPLPLGPGASGMVSAWIVTGDSLRQVLDHDAGLRSAGMGECVRRTRAHWNLWVQAGARDPLDLPEDVMLLYERSLIALRLHQTPSGAILSGVEANPAHPARPEYRWCWHRDASIAADALDRAGYTAAARRYFTFAARSAEEHGGLHAVVDHEGSPVGMADDADALALYLWAVARHFECARDVEFLSPIFRDVVLPTADRMVQSLDRSTRLPLTFDLWGERSGFHASAAAAVRGGLIGAARLAARFGATERAGVWATAAAEIGRAMGRELFQPRSNRFARSAFRESRALRIDPTLDASLLWLGLLDDFEPEDARVRATVEAVRAALWVRTGVGGLARYERDPLGSVGTDLAEVPGNPCVAATLWLAQHAIRTARRAQDLDPARTILLWCAARSEGSGLLPERLHPYRGAIPGPSPSMAAHAWLVATVLDYLERLRMLRRCERCGAPDSREKERASLPDISLPGLVTHS